MFKIHLPQSGEYGIFGVWEFLGVEIYEEDCYPKYYPMLRRCFKYLVDTWNCGVELTARVVYVSYKTRALECFRDGRWVFSIELFFESILDGYEVVRRVHIAELEFGRFQYEKLPLVRSYVLQGHGRYD